MPTTTKDKICYSILSVAEVSLKFKWVECKYCTSHSSSIKWKEYNALRENHGVHCIHYKDLQEMITCIATESISIQKEIHSKGYVHGDVKPENMMLGQPGTPDGKKLFSINFGLGRRWRHSRSDKQVEYDQRPDVLKGTARYASAHVLLGRCTSKTDNLESLAYVMIYLPCGRLPWKGYNGTNR